MDRQAFSANQILTNTALLSMEKEKLVALGYALEAVMGAGGTVVSGLACAPTTVPSLSVVIGRGSIMTTTAIDSLAYSDLGTDANATIKQGILQEPGVTLTLTPPSTPGYSQVYLIQAKQSDDDTSTTVPFYNASNPSQQYNGPNGSGNATLTLRKSDCVVSLKQGAAASTGSQTTPSPDLGNVGLYTITLVNGQSTITAGQIVQVAGAPFVSLPLPQVPAAIQAQGGNYAVDTGTANALVISLPGYSPSSLPDGTPLRIMKGTSASTGPATCSINGTSYPILAADGTNLNNGELAASTVISFVVRGGSLRLTNAGVPRLAVNPTIYVRTDGSDTNDGSSNDAAHAFLTVQAALAAGLKRFALAGTALTIRLGIPGTYAMPGVLNATGASVVIQGDEANPSSYVLSGSGFAGGGTGCIIPTAGFYIIKGLTLQNTGTINHTLIAQSGGFVTVQNVAFTCTASGNTNGHIVASSAGGVTINTGVTITGSTYYALYATAGQIFINGVALSVLGGPTFAAGFAAAIALGSITAAAGSSVTGSASGPRFLLQTNGVINTYGGGSSFFPGNAAGTIATGGQYA